MNWTKIPTNLLISRTPDMELAAIVKYQLLWADLEYQPTDEIALRYMSRKQLAAAKQYLNDIDAQVVADIKSTIKHRGGQKTYYKKKQSLTQNTDGQCDGHTDSQCDNHTDGADKIRLDNIIKEKEINKEKEPKKTTSVRFVKPTIEQIKEYCTERKNGIDVGYFYDYYERNGWKVGKNPMKDWRACIRTWERNNFNRPSQPQKAKRIGSPDYVGPGSFLRKTEDDPFCADL